MYARTSLLFESIITAITTKQLFLFQAINDNYYLCRRCEHSICYQAKLDVARQELQEGQGELVVLNTIPLNFQWPGYSMFFVCLFVFH